MRSGCEQLKAFLAVLALAGCVGCAGASPWLPDPSRAVSLRPETSPFGEQSDKPSAVIRGQSPDIHGDFELPRVATPTSQPAPRYDAGGRPRQPMPASGQAYAAAPVDATQGYAPPPATRTRPTPPVTAPPVTAPPVASSQPQWMPSAPTGDAYNVGGPAPRVNQAQFLQPPNQFSGAPPGPPGPPFRGGLVDPGAAGPFLENPPGGAAADFGLDPRLPGTPADLFIDVSETQTGRFMFGAGVNSNAGVVGNIVIDERNFDITRFPRSFEDIWNGRAFRGAGQGFRLEALPGSEVQRYMVSFTEPYLFNTPISLRLSGFYFDRRYFDWDEQRLGGRMEFGYQLTYDLSVNAAFRYENVDLRNPRVAGVPELDNAVGDSDLAGLRFSIINDTRDRAFSPTQGYYLQLSFEQVLGTYDYPRGDIDFRRYFLLAQQADGSGRHTLGFSWKAGFTGAQTPIFERYFAGGFSSLRGFDFRGAGPVDQTVAVGGDFMFLGSVEYLMPITADDMVNAVVFCDYGTVEEDVRFDPDTYRVAVGAGLRVYVPAMGPAPIAIDFAVPVSKADTDDQEVLSFFVGAQR